MEYISHPYIVPERVEKRAYQFSISMRSLDGNTLVVIPTGLGKTAIARLLRHRAFFHRWKVLMLCSDKTLVEQHLHIFRPC